ncbi:A-agglutinin anchorage subunit-like [Anabas testudineus]|uniref:A-agglutinin anchorage subunit-like n=1 Tax=Anabas testudineus TaxID=64144 RepID=UPI000E45ED41|nr:A-agglutinin anchorage subunit-like [Anabas testudineus]
MGFGRILSTLLILAVAIELVIVPATAQNTTESPATTGTSNTTAATTGTSNTTAATTGTSNTTTAAGGASNTTTAAGGTSSTTTGSSPTTAASTTEAVTGKILTFKTNETFTSDLLNPSSPGFQNRSARIKNALTPFYAKSFPSFRDIQAVAFSNGSIFNVVIIYFASGSVPNNSAIVQVLINAASNITDFNINVNAIFVDGVQASSGVSHKISVITASCLVLLSCLLSNQHWWQ